jgi:hypothetical protein
MTAERGAAGGEARAARAREVSSHRRDRRRRADASGGRSRGSRRGRDGGRVRARGVRAPEARGRRAGQCAPGAAPQRERRARQGAERPPRARHIPLLLGSPENAAGTEGCARRDDRASEASRRRDLHARRAPTTRGSREGRGPTIRRVSPGDARTGVAPRSSRAKGLNDAVGAFHLLSILFYPKNRANERKKRSR